MEAVCFIPSSLSKGLKDTYIAAVADCVLYSVPSHRSKELEDIAAVSATLCLFPSPLSKGLKARETGGRGGAISLCYSPEEKAGDQHNRPLIPRR